MDHRRPIRRQSPQLPHRSRRLPDEGRRRERHLRRQGEEPPQPGRRRTSPRRPPTTPASATGSALIARHRLHRDRRRDRGHVHRSPDDQGHPAEVQQGPQGRQDLPVPADPHPRGVPAGRDHPQAAAQGRAALRPVHQHRAPARRGRTCSSGCSSSAPARSTSSRATTGGGGSGRACCTASATAPPRATSACQPRGLPPADPEADLRARREEGQADPADGAARWRAASDGAELREGRAASATRSRRSRSSTSAATSTTDVQPEVFPIDPKKGLRGLQKVLGLAKTPRTIEGMDIAHLERPGHGRVAGVVPGRAAVQAGLPAVQDQDAWRAWTTSRRCARW